MNDSQVPGWPTPRTAQQRTANLETAYQETQ